MLPNVLTFFCVLGCTTLNADSCQRGCACTSAAKSSVTTRPGLSTQSGVSNSWIASFAQLGMAQSCEVCRVISAHATLLVKKFRGLFQAMPEEVSEVYELTGYRSCNDWESNRVLWKQRCLIGTGRQVVGPHVDFKLRKIPP
eukprot:6470712-Amphidinium_carterae.2